MFEETFREIEFGGPGYAVKGHTFSDNAWSYQGYRGSAELATAYKDLLKKVAELKAKGFSAAVYTQLTDVKTEKR